MSEIRQYVIENLAGEQTGPFDSRADAVAAAREARRRGVKVAVIANIYEWTDSELVDPDLEVWPPKPRFQHGMTFAVPMPD